MASFGRYSVPKLDILLMPKTGYIDGGKNHIFKGNMGFYLFSITLFFTIFAKAF